MVSEWYAATYIGNKAGQDRCESATVQEFDHCLPPLAWFYLLISS